MSKEKHEDESPLGKKTDSKESPLEKNRGSQESPQDSKESPKVPTEKAKSHKEKDDHAPESAITGLTTVATMTSKADEEDESRGQWGNQIQFILTCVGLSVGLGNIWRFPTVAYQNGGSAFLIPYITCSLLFGFPMIYLEFLVGQYSRVGPGKAFRKFAPAFEGIGWAMAALAGTVSIYYTVIIAWSLVYMSFTISGQGYKITTCANDWNTGLCIDSNLSDWCFRNSNYSLPIAINGSCYADFMLRDHNYENASTAAEEFFMYWITPRSKGFFEFSSFNWPVAGALLALWLLVFGLIWKGIVIMGYSSYVSATVPYGVIVILFIVGVQLENAYEGIELYLFKPDFSQLVNPQTWANALTQLLFSLSVGYGGLISLASYSKFSNNCFRDALIVVAGDTSMSVIGGVAVYSVLGYLSKATGQDIRDVVKSGPSLAFVVYPEAISKMWFPPLWGTLFFLMLFLLGISSEVALVECLCTCFYDQFKSLRQKKWMVSGAVCLTYLLIGLIFVTDAGYFWFEMWSDYTGSTNACVVVMLEALLITWIYGQANASEDIKEMRGTPSKNIVLRCVGPHSPLWRFQWSTLCPSIALMIGCLTCMRSRMQTKMPDNSFYQFPIAAEVIGWFLNLSPLFCIPFFFIINLRQLKRLFGDESYGELIRRRMFHPTQSLRSFKRMYGIQKALEEPVVE